MTNTKFDLGPSYGEYGRSADSHVSHTAQPLFSLRTFVCKYPEKTEAEAVEAAKLWCMYTVRYLMKGLSFEDATPIEEYIFKSVEVADIEKLSVGNFLDILSIGESKFGKNVHTRTWNFITQCLPRVLFEGGFNENFFGLKPISGWQSQFRIEDLPIEYLLQIPASSLMDFRNVGKKMIFLMQEELRHFSFNADYPIFEPLEG